VIVPAVVWGMRWLQHFTQDGFEGTSSTEGNGYGTEPVGVVMLGKFGRFAECTAILTAGKRDGTIVVAPGASDRP
jgi:hypothetical protein